jgi:hypothetical protein
MTLMDELRGEGGAAPATSPYLNRRLRSLAEVVGWKCPRCDVELDSPDEAEGCRDHECPAIYGNLDAKRDKA